MLSVKKITFIINPIAGGLNKDKLVNYLKTSFTLPGYDLKIRYTEYPSHAFDYAREECKGDTDIIVAVGGDGTINEVARAVSRTSKSLGIIPCGSGNGFARHFGIPLNYKRAVQILLRGNTQYIDAGSINGKDFFCTSGTGFDAETGYFFSNFNRRGLVSYIISFIKVYWGYICKNYKLYADEELIESEAFFVNVANISQFGYHFYVAPGATASDGLLDLVILRKFPKRKSPALILKSFFGTIDRSKYVIHRRVKEVKLLEPSNKKIIHVDGEAGYLDGDIIFRVNPKILKVIIP